MQLAPGCRSLLDPNDRKRAERTKAAEGAAEEISLAFVCGGLGSRRWSAKRQLC